ncbi:hypothetical protein EDB80DRAFT_613663, partial [Ilyonectria destructans]
MSGFEVAGIVLGTIPLLVSALEAYCSLMRDWGKAPSELKSLNRQLTTERAKLYNVCDQLISDVVPQRDIEPMLQDPFGPLWQAKETNEKIRRRLWGSYEPFEDTVQEVGEALDSVMQRLRVHVTHDGKVEWVNRGKMTREFKKLLHRLNRKDYQDALDTISRGISNLEGLARLSVTLEPSRRKQSRGKLFTVLRDLSTSIYRALCSSILCTDTHDVSLELATRFIDIGHEGEDEKILRDAQFKIAISFEVTDGPGNKRFWDEVNIRSALPSTGAPSKPNAVATKTKKIKGVSFSINQKLSFISSAKPPPDVKSALTVLTRSATDIAFIKTPPHGANELMGPPLDLCLTLKNSRQARPVCYGHLIDKGCTNRQFQVYPLGTTANSDDWSIITLNDVLEGKKGLQPLTSLAERVRLALAIASSVLQLSKTPWLPEVLTRNNVHFFRRGVNPPYEQPFLLKSLPKGSTGSLSTGPSAPGAKSALMSNPTLFALGILLLEIILGSTIDQLRDPDDKAFEGDDLGIIRDSIAAHKLLERRVALINPTYKAVVERCIGCTEVKGLDEDDFRQEVYNGVIMELEAILDHTKLG